MALQLRGYIYMKHLALVGAAAIVCAVAAPTVASAACVGNSNPGLLHNGGFESGLTNWVIAFSGGGMEVTSGVHKGGAQSLLIGTAGGENRIYQHVDNTTLGSIYTVCFYLEGGGQGPAVFRAQWDNQDFLVVRNSNQFGFTYYSFNVVATGNDTLSFQARNDPNFYYLDNVNVQLCNTACSFTNGAQAKQKTASIATPKS
jgi:hypothetical protein